MASNGYVGKRGTKNTVVIPAKAGIEDAIARETAMKAWKRAWKIERIEKSNPDWSDPFDRLA